MGNAITNQTSLCCMDQAEEVSSETVNAAHTEIDANKGCVVDANAMRKDRNKWTSESSSRTPDTSISSSSPDPRSHSLMTASLMTSNSVSLVSQLKEDYSFSSISSQASSRDDGDPGSMKDDSTTTERNTVGRKQPSVDEMRNDAPEGCSHDEIRANFSSLDETTGEKLSSYYASQPTRHRYYHGDHSPRDTRDGNRE